MLARVYATEFLSVCLCVKHMLCKKTAKNFVEILLPPDSPIILVFHHQGSLLNSDGFTLTGVPNTRGWENWVWETDIVTIEVKLETIPKLSNGGTFDDLEWPHPQFQGHL